MTFKNPNLLKFYNTQIHNSNNEIIYMPFVTYISFGDGMFSFQKNYHWA